MGIEVRKVLIKDIDKLYKWWNDGEIMKSVGFPRGLGITKENIEEIINKSNKNSELLIVEVDNTSIGEFHYKSGEKSVEVGIKICEKSYQQKGYGKSVMKIMMNRLFSEFIIEKIVLDTCSENYPAQKLYESLGFEKIRYTKDSWKDQEGNSRSHIDYELTRRKWDEYGERLV